MQCGIFGVAVLGPIRQPEVVPICASALPTVLVTAALLIPVPQEIPSLCTGPILPALLQLFYGPGYGQAHDQKDCKEMDVSNADA